MLLEHLGAIEDPREPWRVTHPLPEVLLLVVCERRSGPLLGTAP